jgi:outer membrane receptor for ferrienterochelin and colicin
MQIHCGSILALPFVLISTLACAQETDYFALSLEELMQVTVASKTAEDFLQAPSVVSVINKESIEKLGGRHLRDILDRMVNMQVVGSNLYPHNRLSVRGVIQTHTDNKVLILLNGHVLRDANQGGINTDIYNLFPIELIEKIEIIRGPGSILYGTNAFSGVVNIITKKSDHDNAHSANSELNLSLGTHSTHSATVSHHKQHQDYRFDVALNQQKTEGETFHDLNGEFGSSGDYPTDKEIVQMLINGHYKSVSVNGLISDSSQGHVKSLYQFPSSTLDIQRGHLDVGYEYKGHKDWTSSSNITYNFHEVAFDISNSRDTQTDSHSYLWEIKTIGQLSEGTSLILGASYELLEGTIGNNSDTPTHFNTDRQSTYGQVNWQLSKKRKLVFGAQINKAEFTDYHLAPRFAYIHTLNSNWTGKVLYGEAYRSPFATDLFLNSPSLQGSEDLKAETIGTFDFQMSYHKDNVFWSNTLYESEHDDLHQRETINDIPTFVNKGSITYAGLETELRYQWSEKTEVLANASYQKSLDNEGINNATFQPQTMIKFGISHQLTKGTTLSVHDSYFEAPTTLEEIGLTPSATNENPSDYHLVTFNLVSQLKAFTSNPFWHSSTVKLYIDNVLDETIYFTSINRQNVNSVPHHMGINGHISFQMGF